jgi:hypothetical protein
MIGGAELGTIHDLAVGLYILGHWSRAIKEILRAGLSSLLSCERDGLWNEKPMLSSNAAGIPATVKIVRSDRPASEDSDSRSVGLFP